MQHLELYDNNLTGAPTALCYAELIFYAEVSILSCMPYLVALDLSGNRLNKIPELHPAPSNLQELDLSRNQITSMGDFSAYRYLKHLCLDRNLIKKMSGLEKCIHLTHLSLRHNGISRIECLAGLPLKLLDLV